MKLIFRSLIVLLVFLAGCVPQFDNFVVPTKQEKVESAPYLGIWKLTKMFGFKPGEDVFLSVQKEGEHLKVIMSPKRDFSATVGIPKPSSLLLTQLGKNTIAFSTENRRQFSVGKLVFKPGGKQLGVEILNPTKLEMDVKNGTVKGVVTHDRVMRDTSIRIAASAKDLRKYLTQQAQFKEAFVLTRIP